MKKLNLPPIGLRIVKSAIAVFLTFIVFFIRGRVGAPLYGAMTALFCMREDSSTALEMAKQRATGTFIGGFFGLFIVLARVYIFLDNDYIIYVLSALMIIPVIYFTVIFNQKDISYFSCVVFLSVAVAPINVDNPYLFVTTRIFETLIGIAVGVFVNFFRLPKKRDKKTLFVSDVNGSDCFNTTEINNYTKFELNRMIYKGLNFTISTSSSPATIHEKLSDINFNLPIVAMDGAVLYDFQNNQYLEANYFTEENAKAILEKFREIGINGYTNQVHGNTLLIFHGDLRNEAEIFAYEKNKSSPYRNYIMEKPYHMRNIIYFMAIDTTQKIDELCNKISEFTIDFKIVVNDFSEMQGFKHIRIYPKTTSTDKMIQIIKEKGNFSNIINYSSPEFTSNYNLKSLDFNVKLIKNDFEKKIF